MHRPRQRDGERARRTEDEAIAVTGGAADRGWGDAADPHRNGVAWRVGELADALDAVELAGEIDQGFKPQLAHEADLFVEDLEARGIVDVQRLELDRVGAGADAEDQATTAEHGDLRGLLGDERRLALGEDEDAGGQRDARGEGGHVGEQGKRLPEHVLVGVVLMSDQVLAAELLRADRMIVGDDAIEAEAFGGLGPVAHGDGVVADLGGREDRAEFHGSGSRNVGHPQLAYSLRRLLDG